MEIINLEIKNLEFSDQKFEFESTNNKIEVYYKYKNQPCVAVEFADLEKGEDFYAFLILSADLENFDELIVDFDNQINFEKICLDDNVFQENEFNYLRIDTIKSEFSEIEPVLVKNNVIITIENRQKKFYRVALIKDLKNLNLISNIKEIPIFDDLEALIIEKYSKFKNIPTFFQFTQILNIYRNTKFNYNN